MFNILFGSSLERPKNTVFDGEDDDEHILYLFRRSFITNVDWIFFSMLLIMTPWVASLIFGLADDQTKSTIPYPVLLAVILFWYLFTAGYIFQNFLNWFFNVYIVTNKRIMDIDFVGLLYKNLSEAPLTSIEDVTSNVKGALRVTFNYGSVLIQTAAELREFEFTDVANPSRIRDIISDIVTNLKHHKV